MNRLILGLLAPAVALATATPLLAADGKWLDEGLAVRKEIIVKPGPGGAGLDAKVAVFPFALRLSAQTLAFDDAQPDGADLRVAGPNGERVDHYIENFDAKAGLATVWVKGVDLDPASTHTYHLYYKGDVTSTANPAAIFDASEVMAFDFSGGPAKDRTRNNNSATNAPTAAGFAGQSATFSGTETMRIASSSSLEIAGRPFTLMLWVKPRAASSAVLVGRAGSFTVALNGLTPTASVGGVAITATAPIVADSWSHLALVGRSNGRVELYVNGKVAGAGRAALPAQAGDIVVGQGLVGQIDNLRLAAADRSPGYVNAVAQSDQGRGLVSFGAEEERSGKFKVGYFVTVITSVTMEGWVVIGLCGLLLAAATQVMVQKFGMLKRIEAQNETFEQAYAASPALDSAPLGTAATAYTASTLSGLYQAGLLEVAHRSTNGAAARFNFAGIEALKARIDAVLSNQAYSLSDKLVILTLSISGGPFLGLLGTVIGVMITFAAIAAEGNVNVNAIAPGVAAALLATAAGLAVAIPALFGYNLILTRIKRINARNRAFADALVARIAEQYAA